jgi:hypothetical protein
MRYTAFFFVSVFLAGGILLYGCDLSSSEEEAPSARNLKQSVNAATDSFPSVVISGETQFRRNVESKEQAMDDVLERIVWVNVDSPAVVARPKDSPAGDSIRSLGRSYLDTLVTSSSALFEVNWTIRLEDATETNVSTLAVVGPEGRLLYEPLLDASWVPIRTGTGSPPSSLASGKAGATGTDWFKAENLLGVNKVTGALYVEESGGNQCVSDFQGQLKTSASLPFFVDEGEAYQESDLRLLCRQKENCECNHKGETRRDKMECADKRVVVSWGVSIGWKGIGEVYRRTWTLEARVCANGQAGRGTF